MSQITTNQRVAYLRGKLQLNQANFSAKLNVSRSYLADIESGRTEPSFNFLRALLVSTDVSSDWILTGEGEMWRSAKSPSLTPTESRLLENFRKCPPTLQANLLQASAAFAGTPTREDSDRDHSVEDLGKKVG